MPGGAGQSLLHDHNRHKALVPRVLLKSAGPGEVGTLPWLHTPVREAKYIMERLLADRPGHQGLAPARLRDFALGADTHQAAGPSLFPGRFNQHSHSDAPRLREDSHGESGPNVNLPLDFPKYLLAGWRRHRFLHRLPPQVHASPDKCPLCCELPGKVGAHSKANEEIMSL